MPTSDISIWCLLMPSTSGVGYSITMLTCSWYYAYCWEVWFTVLPNSASAAVDAGQETTRPRKISKLKITFHFIFDYLFLSLSSSHSLVIMIMCLSEDKHISAVLHKSVRHIGAVLHKTHWCRLTQKCF